jgi:hypothetical protein
MTNALRYSAGSAVRVVVKGEPDRVDVSVVNGPTRPEATLSGAGTGNGLRGPARLASHPEIRRTRRRSGYFPLPFFSVRWLPRCTIAKGL